jgi:hypothetical protein
MHLRQRILATLVLIAISLVAHGCSARDIPAPSEQPVAIVDGHEITAGELRGYVADELSLRGLDPRTTSAGPVYAYASQILDQLVDVVAAEHALDPADRDAIAARVDLEIRRERRRAGSEAAFLERLRGMGMTPGSLRHGMYRQGLLETLARRRGLEVETLRRQLRGAAAVRLRLDESSLYAPRGAVASRGELLAVAFGVLVLCAGLAAGLRRVGADRILVLAFLVGSLVRVGLWASTPWDVRAHDPDEHLEYIAHVARTHSIPDSKAGFMFYQPPIYYFLVATLVGSGPVEESARAIQTAGLGFSVATLAVGIGLLGFVFPVTAGRWKAALGAFILAGSPSLAFLAARVNNDSLSVLVNLTALFLLMAWWRNGRWSWWIATTTVLAVGLLVKSTALLLLIVATVCALLRPGARLGPRMLRVGAGLLIVTVLCGWFWVLRAREGQEHLVGSLGESSPQLLLTGEKGDFLTFNPVRLVERPFVNPWIKGRDRDAFWEYLVRSALFGQHAHTRVPLLLARATVVAALGFLGFVLAGLARVVMFRPRDALPLVLLLAVELAGHIAYVVSAPFSASQDFRYSLLLLLPLCFLFAHGAGERPAVALAQRLVGSTFAALQLLFLSCLILG